MQSALLPTRAARPAAASTPRSAAPAPRAPRVAASPAAPAPARRAVATAAITAKYLDAAVVAPTPVKGEKTDWFALVASADFMLHDVQNEAFPEQLRERLRLFKEKGRAPDFFLVSQPAWLDTALPPADAARVRRPAVALVSTDEVWITFMKLRLDRVLGPVELGAMTPATALASAGPPPDFAPLDRSPEAGPWTAPYSPYKPGWWNVFMDTDLAKA